MNEWKGAIRQAGEADRASWTSFVERHEHSGPYHQLAWNAAIAKAYGHRTYSFIAEDERGGIQGVLPMVLMRKPWGSAQMVSQPYCDYGWVLSRDQGTGRNLALHAREVSEGLGARMSIRTLYPEDMFADGRGIAAVGNKVQMVLDLPGSAEALWAAFPAKLRSQIRRPLKEGMSYVQGRGNFLDDFYDVLGVNMRDLGSPVHSRAWFRAVLEAFGEDARIGVVYAESRPVAAGVFLNCGDMVCVPWASSLRSHNRFSPNMLLYWNMLSFACDNGYRRFNFGRSSPDEGTFRFKSQWGAKPQELYWYEQRQGQSFGLPLLESRVRPFVERCWAGLPLAVANTAGPLIRRHISL